VFDYYDIPGAAGGGAGQQTPEERELRRVRNMIKAAESTNYDGDPDYYGQIKALALQAGIPIKKFKTNPYRLAKAGLMSFADTALLGLIPNSMYAPQNEAEEMAIMAGGIGGMLVPWGAPQRLWNVGKGLYQAGQFGKFGAGGALGNAGKVFTGRMTPEQYAAAWKARGATPGGGSMNINPALQGANVGGQSVNKLLAGAGGPRMVTPSSQKLAEQALRNPGIDKKSLQPHLDKILNQNKPKKGTPRPTRNTQNKQATQTRKTQKSDRRKEAPNMNVKMSKNGKLSNAERKKVHDLLKPSEYKKWQKTKDKDAKKALLQAYLNKYKVKFTIV
tara:strand:+ start:10690 stop:11685 length:996 start_codon:yes stop_codon:yes gene_type:complete